MKKSKFLTKDNTSMLHGLAILMMVYHHLFVGGNTWHNGEPYSLLDVFDFLNISLSSAQLTFAWFCKICVAIFAFTSGYAMYAQLDKKVAEKMDFLTMYKYCFKRLWSFYKKFLLAFLFFISCEYFKGNPNGFDFSLENYIMNLLGLRATFNGTWWYISIYYLMIFTSPIWYFVLNKFKLRDYLILIGAFILSFVIAFATGNLIAYAKGVSGFIQNYVIIYLLIFMEGMFSNKFLILDFIGEKLNLILSILLLVVTYIARALLIRAPSDSLFDLVLIIPIIISFVNINKHLPKLSKGLSFIGKYSSYMWYAHAYFYSYLFFNLVIRSNLSLIVFIQVVLYSLLSGIAFTFVEKQLTKLFTKKKV